MSLVERTTTDQVSAQFSDELKAPQMNVRNLLDLMHTIMMLLHHESAQADRKDASRLTEEHKLQVQIVSDGHMAWGRTISIAVSAVVSLAAGAIGFYASFQGLANWQKLAEFGQIAAKGPEMGSQLFTSWRDAAQVKNQALQTELEKKRDSRKNSENEHARQVDQAKQAASEANRLFHEVLNALSQPITT